MITLNTRLEVSGTVTLTDDIFWPRANGVAIQAVGPTIIDLNGYRIFGVGGAGNTSYGIFANNQSNITVKNGSISGFATGVNVLDSVAKWTKGYSQTNNTVDNLNISDCIVNGFQLGGKDCKVTNTRIWNIGLDDADDRRAYGGQFFGPNAMFDNNHVSKLYGGSESVGVSFTGRLQTGSVVSNSTLDGRLASAQSFGIWNSSRDPITVTNSYLNDWDFTFGGASTVAYGNSTFARNLNDFGYSYGSADMDGLSVFVPIAQYTLGQTDIIGDTVGGRYFGSSDGDFIAGLQGHDHLFGAGGSDIFAFVIRPSGLDKDVILSFDYQQNDKLGFDRHIFGAADANGAPRLQIGISAVGKQATFVEDPTTWTLYYDPDGAGSDRWIPLAYLPYYVLTPADLIWLTAPLPSDPVISFSGWTMQAFGDFNGDGYVDLTWRNASGVLGEWLMRDGDRAMTVALPKLAGWELLTAGDFNGDGTSDLLWRNGSGVVSDWLMNGGRIAATFRITTVLPGTEVLTTGDFNGDAITDVVWQDAAGTLSGWEMGGGQRVAVAPLPTMKGWKLEATGDFNGDGTDDLIWQNRNGVVGAWLMHDFDRAATMTLSTTKGWAAIAAADFNDDGTDDVLWQDVAGGALIVWMMQAGKVSDTAYYGQSSGAELLAVGNLDGSGGADLMWRELATSSVKYWSV